MRKLLKGQSMMEFIVAVSIFLMIASAGVSTILGAFLTSRQAEEETQASFLCSNGSNAVESLRNTNWEALTDGEYGLSSTSNIWTLSGNSETNLLGKYNRSISITTFERDASGNIVSSGGTPDPDTKLVSCNVSWNFNPARSLSVNYSKFQTNWQEARGLQTPILTVTPTPTSGPTVTNTVTPSPTPVGNTCAQICNSNGYTIGTCRKNPGQCSQNAEKNVPFGNQFCPANNSTCCCKP